MGLASVLGFIGIMGHTVEGAIPVEAVRQVPVCTVDMQTCRHLVATRLKPFEGCL